MTNRIEKRVLWNPRHENKFIIGGGSQITLFEWDSSVPEFRHVTSQSDLLQLRCLAWSPDPKISDLVAVGLGTGQVDLLRLEAGKQARNNIVSTGPVASLQWRTPRNCNALAFSSTNPNLLGACYDKVRAESNIVVWDLETVSYSPDQLSTPYATSYLSRAGPIRIEPRNTFTSQEHISCITFLPRSSDFLLAGTASSLKLVDIRTPGTQSQAPQAKANKVQGLATDPFNDHQFASFGDSVVSVWDSRRFTEPLLAFTMKDAAQDGAHHDSSDTFTGVEFSSVRRGLLASLVKDDKHVRFWDIQHSQTTPAPKNVHPVQPQRESSKDSSRSGKLSRLAWGASANILTPWPGQSESSQAIFGNVQPANLGSVVLANTYKTKSFGGQVVSFALAPDPNKHPLTSNIVVVKKEGDIEMYAIHDTPTYLVWSSRGEMTLGAGVLCRFFPGFRESGPPPEPWEVSISPEGGDGRQEKSVERQGKRKSSRPRSRIISLEEKDFSNPDLNEFPILSTIVSGRSVSATRHSRTRTFSPASIHRFPLGSKRDSSRDASRTRETMSKPSHDSGASQRRTHSSGRHTKGDIARASSRSRHSRTPEFGIARLIERDISMEMRSRIIAGYGLQSFRHNVKVISKRADAFTGDDALIDIWSWLNHSKQLLTFGSQKVHGFDFSYRGILDIWEGLEAAPSQDVTGLVESLDLAGSSDVPLSSTSDSQLTVDVTASLRPRLPSHRSHGQQDGFHGNYNAALTALNSHHNDSDRSTWRFTIHTSKASHRKLGLSLCNWKVGEEEFQRWEREGKISQAACWLLFTNQGGRAIDVLMRSKDESHQMMSAAFAALLQSGPSSRNSELREYCQRLINKLQDPYFRMMLSYIVFNDWVEVVEEQSISLQERLGMALRYLNDEDLGSFLRRVTARCCSSGDLEGLMLTGLTSRGIDLLQSYVDMTSDVQSAALLASLVCPAKFKDRRVDCWVEAYRDLLDGWKLFHHRSQFDIDRGKIIQEAMKAGDPLPQEWVKTQFIMKCNYCNAAVNSLENRQKKLQRAGACPECGKPLPLCNICLMSINIVPDNVRENNLLRATSEESVDDAFVFCQNCRHGGHAAHILEWFLGSDDGRSCAVPDCDCHCDAEYKNSM